MYKIHPNIKQDTGNNKIQFYTKVINHFIRKTGRNSKDVGEVFSHKDWKNQEKN